MPRPKPQIRTSENAERATEQHQKPCGDCPWRQHAIPGWLGGMTAEEWLEAAHGDGRIDCHTLIPMQCAGAAIYRANQCKLPRDLSALRLPSNRQRVFATRDGFRNHHTRTKPLKEDPR